MTIEKKKLYSYTEVTTSGLADKIPTLQGGVNKATTLQKIYNLFKNSFDSVYTTASAVATQISTALSGYATTTVLVSGLSTKQDIQNIDQVPIDASANTVLSSTNCILSISNIPVGTGNKEIKMRLNPLFWEGIEFISCTLNYKGFDVNLRSWAIYDDGTGNLFLSLYINVHSNPTEPVLIAINKIN